MPNIPDAAHGLSQRQAAEYMGVHYNTMNNWVKGGLVPVTRFGPKGHIIRIHKQDLDALRKEGGKAP